MDILENNIYNNINGYIVSENIYLNTFKIWAKVSKKNKNDELYTEETNTILKAVGNNLKELKEEYVRLKNIEKRNKHI